jgi:hypothetical protein
LEKGTQLFSSDGSLPPTESLEKSCVPFSFSPPPGAKRDKTLSPGFYEGVSQYLTDLGVPQV